MNDKMFDALNKQLGRELYSSYLYLAMSAFFAEKNLPGMANWMRVQAQEELQHAMLFFDFIIARGHSINLPQIDQPGASWHSPIEVFEAAYKHEVQVSKWIHELLDIAMEQKDHPSTSFLYKFVDEQVEEEATVLDIVEKLKLLTDNQSALFMLDKELGSRTLQ
jgi:ferritin